MVRESSSFFSPRVSLRTPAFIGPVTLGTLILVASMFTTPFDQDFRLVRLSDPTFVGTIGIWGVCTEYRTENATTVNPAAVLTGNATFDAMVHSKGIHKGCSPASFGWTFSVPVNSTGLVGMPLPDSGHLGVNIDPEALSTADTTWVQVVSKSESSMVIVQVVAGLLPTLGLLLLIIPYKPFETSSPGLARVIKSGSISLLLVVVGCFLTVVSFGVTYTASRKIRDDINNAGAAGGLHASMGNIHWLALVGAVLMVPSIWSTRGQMGDK